MIIGTIAKNPYKPVHGFACHALGLGVVLPKNSKSKNQYEKQTIQIRNAAGIFGGNDFYIELL
ncbi:MAG: hypothetical protein J6Y14_10085 [Fibrobacter sp.]|nr:hypothetical protein [Fibrobacter sp.]